MKHLHSKYKLHFNLKGKQRVCRSNFLMAGNFLIEAHKCKIYFTFNQKNSSSDQGVCICCTSHLSVVKETILTTHDPTLYFRHLIHYSKQNKLNIQDTYPALTSLNQTNACLHLCPAATFVGSPNGHNK